MIPSGNVTLTKGVGAVTVAVKVAALTIPTGVYTGRIVDATLNPIARNEVDLP
jgi:hypothetical protein